MKRTAPVAAMALVSVSFTLAGCSDDESTSQPSASGDVLLAPPPVGQGRQLSMQARVEAGDEIEYCQYVVLPEAIDVASFEHRYSPGSHHLLLYLTTKTADDVAGDTERFDCASRDDLGLGGIAYAAQVPEGATAFPDGVAMRFAKGQVVLMQSHYFNTTGAALDADVRLNMWQTKTPLEQEAGTLFFYDYTIAVPPHGSAEAEMRCAIPKDIHVAFAMSHMHRRGVGYHAALEGGDLEAPQTLYDTTQWERVEPAVLDPPLTMKAGQTVRFSCSYQNETDQFIVEGPSAAKNEMCMFIATYWPRLEFEDEFCARPGSGPVFHGERTCAETLACAQGAGDPVAVEQCQVETCEASSAALGDFNGCMFYRCNAECITGTDGCSGCVAKNCLDQYQACQAAGC